MARRHKRLWTDDEKRSICLQTTAPGVSVAQVARRYAMNANLIFTWLRDPRFKPEAVATASPAAGEARFLPVEIIDSAATSADASNSASGTAPNGNGPDGVLEIDLVGGHRLRVTGAFDAEALAVLIRRLSS